MTLVRGENNIERDLIFHMFSRAQRSLGFLKGKFITVGNADDEYSVKLNILKKPVLYFFYDPLNLGCYKAVFDTAYQKAISKLLKSTNQKWMVQASDLTKKVPPESKELWERTM